MQVPKFHFLVGFLALTLLLLGGGWASAQPISQAMEQEFLDARNAIDSAQKVQAEKFSPEPLKQAQDFLVSAEGARTAKDAVKFTQASRLSRAYAELAKANAELKAEEEKLAATQEELQKAKAEIERLKKSQ